jgi:hypothetical protein
MSLSDKEKKKLVGLSPKARVALISKFIDAKVRARRARLTPALAALGSRCVNAAGALKEFLDFEERSADVALAGLIARLRHRRGRGRNAREKADEARLWEEMDVLTLDPLTLIADMLDPDKPGPWKLWLRRNVRGAPSDKYGEYYHWIAMEYFELFEELEAQGVRSPAKETRRRLMKEWKWSENDIRSAVQWWRKRGLKLKR